MTTDETKKDARHEQPERRDEEGRVVDPEPLDPEPLDPDPLAIDREDVEDFVDRFGDEERTVRTRAQPPG